MSSSEAIGFRWLRTGDDAFAAMLAAISAARSFLKLEMYIFSSGRLGQSFRDELVRAARRGVRVQALVDAFGSITLTDSFWEPLRKAGGDMRWFNPIALKRFNIRNHRKLLVCDEESAIIGGFNIAPEWQGDGITRGWRDLGLQVTGPLAQELSASFDDMFARADFKHKRFIRLRRRPVRQNTSEPAGQLLLSGPGRGRSPIKLALRRDLVHARTVQIVAAYFLPPLRLRRALMHVARRGGRVQLILPGKSDVPLMQLAARSLFQRLLRAGVEIYEYEPQILHTKLVVVDGVAYAGSSNLDTRSLNINYELLVRLTAEQTVTEARDIFADHLSRSRQVHRMLWRKSRTLWNKFKERWAYFFFARLDPYVARWQLKAMR
ncbi:MAG TPA: phospholipase D-like domain-containing protein [Candidatus Angelobacter sp.]|nr:phospholipase D-like domain-containing protein [Candidatus Angelobacter sp.]